MQEHSGNEKSAVWSAVDFDGEKQTPEMFCVRFASQERAQQFIAAHGKAMDHNEGVRMQTGQQVFVYDGCTIHISYIYVFISHHIHLLAKLAKLAIPCHSLSEVTERLQHTYTMQLSM